MRVITTITILFLFCTGSHAQPEGESNTSSSFFIPTEKTIYYKLGERTIPIHVSNYGDANGVVLINLHANETTSIEAAKSVLESKGGTLIRVGNGQQRVIRFRLRGVFYSIDPNRMFSRAGIEQSLKENGRISPAAIDEVESFGQRILALITENSNCIIALHNNTNEAFSVKSYQRGNVRQYDAREVYADPSQDVDDIALTTDSLLYRAMADLKYNSIWQDNEKAKKDGSLSVWCGENGRRYINIETEHGRLRQYREMLEKLMQFLNALS